MLVVTFIAPEVVEELEALPVEELAAVRSGTGDPVAEASTPAITGPLSGVYKYKDQLMPSLGNEMTMHQNFIAANRFCIS